MNDDPLSTWLGFLMSPPAPESAMTPEQNRPQRSMPLRLRPQIQTLLRRTSGHA